MDEAEFHMAEKKKYQRRSEGYSRYAPEDRYVRIAKERIRDIVRGWAAEAPWKPIDLMILAESCYLQGLADMTDAAIRNGWIPGPKPEPEPPESSGATALRPVTP